MYTINVEFVETYTDTFVVWIITTCWTYKSHRPSPTAAATSENEINQIKCLNYLRSCCHA